MIQYDENNIMLQTDSYKASHYVQYPPGTTKVYSYFESRGGDFKETVFFGLQYILKKHFEGQVVTKERIDEAEAFWNAHFGTKMFNRSGWEHILERHSGRLPLRITAVPEGTPVGIRNVLITVENTDPECYWLTNFVETILVQTWYPTTVATNSREIKKTIKKYLDETGNPKGLPFKLHDFGYRGVSSSETAAIGGAAHLVNFMGTDTVAGIILANNYYNAGMCGFSIPASEHSTITSWGREHEVDAFANMLQQYPSGTVACVSDSFNIFDACKNYWGGSLKEKILGRDGTLVIRPDSGDPIEVLSRVLDILWDCFPETINHKGYKVLDDHVRLIQGDGIDRKMVEDILAMTKAKKFSADNIAFGSGGGLLQKFDRDTCKFAFKCSYAEVNGEKRDVFKQPVTSIDKSSKRGRLALVKNGSTNEFQTVPELSKGDSGFLKTVFEDGNLINTYNFEEIRKLAEI
jgi:nicotinamide phosphoribosyltransferase